MNRKINLYLLLIFLLSICTPQIAPCAISNNSTSTELINKSKTKKDRKMQRQQIKKQLKLETTTKGIFATIFGGLSLIGTYLSIAASFALSTPGVIIGITLGAGFGIAALVMGISSIKAAKTEKNTKGKIFGLIGSILGGVSLLVLLGLSIGAIFF